MAAGLFRRGGSDSVPMSRTIYDLLIALLVLAICALILIGTILLLRRRRAALRAAALADVLPVYTEKRSSSYSSHSNHRRVTARPVKSVQIYTEKEMLFESPPEPSSPMLPEIRVTFPEEVDETGKLQSGKVVVVRVGDTGIGLECVAEPASPYAQSEGERFHSVDLDRVGGLVEQQPRPKSGWP